MTDQILNRSYPILQRRTDDWLGDGLYYWQDAPHRALWWAQQRVHRARKRHLVQGPHRPAVLRAEVDLGGGLDLLDRTPTIEQLLRLAFELERATGDAPRRNQGDSHTLDCAVINSAVAFRLTRVGIVHKVVRGVFVNEHPTRYYEGSALLKEAHVQFAVRTWAAIRQIEPVDRETIKERR